MRGFGLAQSSEQASLDWNLYVEYSMRCIFHSQTGVPDRARRGNWTTRINQNGLLSSTYRGLGITLDWLLPHICFRNVTSGETMSVTVKHMPFVSQLVNQLYRQLCLQSPVSNNVLLLPVPELLEP